MTQQGLRKRKRGAQAGLAPRHSLEEGAFSLLAAHQGLEATPTCQPSKPQTTDCRANAVSNPVPRPTTNQITNPKPLTLSPCYWSRHWEGARSGGGGQIGFPGSSRPTGMQAQSVLAGAWGAVLGESGH